MNPEVLRTDSRGDQGAVVLVRTPLRVSFLGGGSDVREFYSKSPGFVVSTAIDCYIDVMVRARHDGRIRVVTNVVEVVNHPSQLSNLVVRAALEFSAPEGGYDLVVISDVTRAGSGLGSSSALIVAILYAMARWRGENPTPSALARSAAHVEIEAAGRPIGLQDHYPPAFGGLCCMEFKSEGRVELSRPPSPEDITEKLNSLMVLVDTGVRRDAAATLAHQTLRVSGNRRKAALSRLTALARAFEHDLSGGSLEGLPQYLQEAWHIKATLGALDGRPELVKLYEIAIAAGALGGKVLGAGGGGHFLFLVPLAHQDRFNNALLGARHWRVKIAKRGCHDLIPEHLE